MLPVADRVILRDLAKRKAEYAALPVMAERAKRWLAHNDYEGGGPMIAVEISSFAHELLPPLSCDSPEGQAMERNLRLSMLRHEHIGDDWVVAPVCEVPPVQYFFYFGIKPERVYSGTDTHQLGYSDVRKIGNLAADMSGLQRSIWGYDREATRLRHELARDVLGDILDVKIEHLQPKFTLTRSVVELMGMETMFFNMMDYPELFYSLLSRMTDDYLEYFKCMEEEGLLSLNNSVTEVWPTTHGYTKHLGCTPGKHVTTGNLWIGMDSQETLSVSPRCFGGMFFPHYQKAAANFGRLCYGCCEPVDRVWEWVSQLHGLSKISVSPWCDVVWMADRLRGREIILHRKLSPNYVGLGDRFDEQGFAHHVTETLKAARGCHLEIAARDINTLCGDLGRARRSVEIIRNLIEQYWEE